MVDNQGVFADAAPMREGQLAQQRNLYARQRLDAIEAEIRQAARWSGRSTPAGDREFSRFLAGKTRDIQKIVSDAAADDAAKAAALRNLTSAYSVPGDSGVSNALGEPLGGPKKARRPRHPRLRNPRSANQKSKPKSSRPHSNGTRGMRISGFVTAAQCAHGDSRAAVSVMRAGADGMDSEIAAIGTMAYVAPGDQSPGVADEPWTIATSPLAMFSSGRSGWVMPVEITVNDKRPTHETVGSAAELGQWAAAVAWTDSRGVVVGGHVLDPSSTPRLKDIPPGVERIVVAADDKAAPITPWERGSPVTTDVDGATRSVGIIVATDTVRHWVVVDLIGPFLAERSARIITAE